jgi:hypothetical protein
MDHERIKIEALARRPEQFHLRRIGQTRAPHPRARGKNLKSISAQFGSRDRRPLQSVRCKRVDA